MIIVACVIGGLTGCADLIVRDVAITPLHYEPVWWRGVKATAVVRNVGSSQASASHLSFLHNGWSAVRPVPALGPGEEHAVTTRFGFGFRPPRSFPWTADARCFQVIASADAEHEVDESRENNNKLARKYWAASYSFGLFEPYAYVGLPEDIVMTTVAGTGPAGFVAGGAAEGAFAGDDGPARNARLNKPMSIAFRDGSLYIADWMNGRIRRVVPGDDGVVDLVGTETISTVRDLTAFGLPRAIAFGPDGSLYVGTFSTILRVTPGTDGIVDGIGDETVVIVAGQNWSGLSGDGGIAVEAQIQDVYGIAFGPDGSLYIADMNNLRIRRVAPGSDGIVTGDDSGELISTVAGSGDPGVTNAGFAGDDGPATEAQLAAVQGVVVASDGSLYIADAAAPNPDGTANSRVRRIAPGSDGIVTGSTDEIITTVADLFDPDPESESESELGFGPKLNIGGFDADGNLYAMHGGAGNEYVLRIEPGPDGNIDGIDDQIVSVAGDGSTGYNGDGPVLATKTMLMAYNVALGPDGNIYVVDTGNHRIRRVAPIRCE